MQHMVYHCPAEICKAFPEKYIIWIRFLCWPVCLAQVSLSYLNWKPANPTLLALNLTFTIDFCMSSFPAAPSSVSSVFNSPVLIWLPEPLCI